MLDKACQVGRHPTREHQLDCYDTPPCAVRALLKVERLPHDIWEPAAGVGNIVRELQMAGHSVMASDITACGGETLTIDFLNPDVAANSPCIVSNPPYRLAEEFIVRALDRAPLVIMLLRLAFLEGGTRSKTRALLLDGGWLARVHVFANRLPMMHRRDWSGKRASSAVPFAWFVWSWQHRGKTMIDRIFWEKA
jgi:hypothetical protein